MPLTCWKDGDDWLVDNGSFRLKFSESAMGISSFAYLLGGAWHEVVNPLSPALLYFPRLTIDGLLGGPIYPYHGGILSADFTGPTFAMFQIDGWLSNATQGTGLAYYPFTTTYAVYEDGSIYLQNDFTNASMDDQILTLEEHLLNPKDDPDIALDSDSDPDLMFAGFYSNNTGSGSDDLSHDGILSQTSTTYGIYITDTDGDRNTVGLAKGPQMWAVTGVIQSSFHIGLSMANSPRDVTSALDFQSVGSLVSNDYQNPDPLTGELNAGDVIIGNLLGGSYYKEGAYLVEAA